MAQALIDEGRIHAGMRVDEVVSLLGDEGRVETASGARAYGYCLGPALEGEGYEFLFVYFDDERTVTTLHRTRF
jgi:hypothetical protein